MKREDLKPGEYYVADPYHQSKYVFIFDKLATGGIDTRDLAQTVGGTYYQEETKNCFGDNQQYREATLKEIAFLFMCAKSRQGWYYQDFKWEPEKQTI